MNKKVNFTRRRVLVSIFSLLFLLFLFAPIKAFAAENENVSSVIVIPVVNEVYDEISGDFSYAITYQKNVGDYNSDIYEVVTEIGIGKKTFLVKPNTSFTITLKDTDGYMCDNITVSGNADNSVVYVYPSWSGKDYTVKFDGNGATEGSMEDLTYTYGKEYVLPVNCFNNSEYTFQGWSFYPNGSSEFDNGEIVSNLTTDSSVTLYAIWSENCTLALNTNRPSEMKSDIAAGVTSYDMVYNASNNKVVSVPHAEGWTFKGYYTSASGGEKIFDSNGMAVKNTSCWTEYGKWKYYGSKTLYAHWEANRYTVRFNGNGSTSGTMGTQVISYDSKTRLNSNQFLKDNYIFAGWSTNSGAKTPDYIDSSYVSNLAKEDGAVVNLYAVWTINMHTLNIYPFIDNISYRSGKTGFTFDVVVKNGSSVYDSAENITMYNKPVPHGSTYEISVKNADGYQITEGDSSGIITNDTVVNPCWQRNAYSLNVVPIVEGNSYPSGKDGFTFSIVIREGTRIFDQQDNIKYYSNDYVPFGYTYSIIPNNLDGYSANKIVGTIQSGQNKVYPDWEHTSYFINYNLDNGSRGENAPSSGTFGSVLTISNPTKTGYVFDGWDITGLDGTVHYFGTESTTNSFISKCKETEYKNLRSTPGTVTFTAKWTANENVEAPYNEGDTVIYTYTGAEDESFTFSGPGSQSFTATKTGTYTLYLRGASGQDTTYVGGKGGYICGTIDLQAGDVVTVEIGVADAGGKSNKDTVSIGTLGWKNNADGTDETESVDTVSGADGGDASRLLVNGKTVLIVGGGGGASALADGFSVENTVYGTEDASILPGESGVAGGGGAGYQGGNAGSNTYHQHIDVNGDISTAQQIDEYGGCYTLASHYHHEPDGSVVEDIDTLMDGRPTEGGCFVNGVHLHVDANGNFISHIVDGAIFDENITQSAVEGGCFTVPVYHSHTDACYVTKTESYIPSNPWNNCNASYQSGSWQDGNARYKCSCCGSSFTGSNGWHRCSGSRHVQYRSYKVLGCGKTENSIEYYVKGCNDAPNNWYLLGCTKSSVSEVDGNTVYDTAFSDGFDYDCYELNCGMTENTVISSIGGKAGTNFVNRDLFNPITISSSDADTGAFYMEFGSENSVYIAPCDGWYDITAIGGAGGNYNAHGSSKTGGSGAVVNGKVHLNKGDVVKVVVGGKASAFNYGGITNDPECGASGGGATTIFINDVLSVVAGGGGGASWADNGGDAGVGGNSIMQGQDGIAGGGGGMSGGLAANIVWHTHSYAEGGCCGPIYETRTHKHHYYQDHWTHDGHTDWIGGEQRTNYPEYDPYDWTCYNCPTYGSRSSYHGTNPPSGTVTYRVKIGQNTCSKQEGIYGDMDIHKASTGGTNYFSDKFIDTSENSINRGNGSITITIYSVDYNVVVNPNGGMWGVDVNHRTDTDTTLLETTRTAFTLENPVRSGFTFQGWDVTDADGKHYFAEADANRSMDPYIESSHTYQVVVPKIKSFLDMRNHNGKVYFKAVWKDDQSPSYNTMWGTEGLQYQNYNIGLLNDDASLLLATIEGNYSVSRQDGDLNDIVIELMEENYQNRYPSFIRGLVKGEDGNYFDYVNLSQHPNYFGTTSDGQRYYLGTWTNKSVTITAEAHDGSSDGETFVSDRDGGSGIYRMRFDEYARNFAVKYPDGTFGSIQTEKDAEDWIYSDTQLTDNSSMTIKKTFTESGIYSGSVTAEDRAGTANTAERGSWIANDQGKITIVDSDGSKSFSTNSGGNNIVTAKYAEIKIDKDSPYVLDPSKMNENTQTFRDAMYMMYEGYNDVRDIENGDTYGWAMDNVRIVIYADDGAGSGVVEQAYCWNKDPNIASNWQSADSQRTWNGKTVNVSTKVVDKNESGYVYVRDAVGNWTRIDYIVDHMDKQDPTVHPDKDPDSENDDPLPPNPLDPDDPDVEEYNPVPDGPYTWEGSSSTNEVKYDWVSKDAVLSIDTFDLEVKEGSYKKYGASGTWSITLYESDENFTTRTETLKNGKTRDRAVGRVLKEVLFKDSLVYTESREGINYYILEVLDKANNLTSVKLTVKLDKTYPGIPYRTSANSDTGTDFFSQNGVSNSVGNDLVSNFGSGKFWSIKQVDLNEVDYDKVEVFVQNEDNMKCSFDFVIHDQNWSGSYAANSDRRIDDSGIESVVLRLFDADNSSVRIDYPLYSYDNSLSVGIGSNGKAFVYQMTECIETNENSVPYLNKSLSGTPLTSMKLHAKINTFTDFPKASAICYEIEISDRAGNVKTYRSQPGNEIRNFSVKAVMHSAEDNEYNEEVEYEQKNVIGNDSVPVTYETYIYSDRLGNQYSYGHALSETEMANAGLTFKKKTSVFGKVTTNDETVIKTLTNVPYYQLGDIGYVEVWTVGYVPQIQFNFALLGDPVGKETMKEILNGRLPSKYNLGVTSNIEFTRYIPYTSGQEVGVSYASKVDGVPFITKYGTKEAEDFEDADVDTQNGWLTEGTSIRLPLYYELQPDGGENEDGTPTYEAELHNAAFYAWKGNWKDTSTASYVLYDTRANDIHYRVTHEG